MEDRERIVHLGDGNPQRVDIPVNLSVGTKVPDIEVGTAAAGRRLIQPDIGGSTSDPGLLECLLQLFPLGPISPDRVQNLLLFQQCHGAASLLSQYSIRREK